MYRRTSIYVILLLGLAVSACARSSLVAGGASVDNAQAAVIILDQDLSVSDDLLTEILDINVEANERLSEDFNARSVSVKATGGEPTGAIFVQIIFQPVVTTADRQVLLERVQALNLDDPIWLGPDDRWPFCREQPCPLVKDDGDFPV